MILALFGPTAAGKSALAHAAALALGGEIVVADPFQRYRGLEIAADAPSEASRAEVPYHFAGDLNLTQTSSAAGYAKEAHPCIDDILARGRTPIVAGGTGLYLRAALADLDFPDDVSAEIRTSVEHLIAADLPAAIDELRQRDPQQVTRTDVRNPPAGQPRIGAGAKRCHPSGTRPPLDRHHPAPDTHRRRHAAANGARRAHRRAYRP